MKFVFLMDPLEGISFRTDTTFPLMLETHDRGHDVYYLPKDGISLQDGKVHFRTLKVKPQNIEHELFSPVQHAVDLTQNDVDVLFIRTDPPFDAQYLMNTWLLDHLPSRIKVINNPTGVRTVNEKVWVARFWQITPPTLISCNKHDLNEFIFGYKNVIAKPTDSFGGQRIFHIEAGHTNAHVILETLTKGYNEPIILQKYIPEAKNGDKRILLLNGELLGAVLRHNETGDHRNNLYAGGIAKPAVVTDKDHKIIETLKPHLQKLGLYFVGIDILGEYLIEVNVTSPTCLQEMNRLYNVRLEEKVIDFVEKLLK